MVSLGCTPVFYVCNYMAFVRCMGEDLSCNQRLLPLLGEGPHHGAPWLWQLDPLARPRRHSTCGHYISMYCAISAFPQHSSASFSFSLASSYVYSYASVMYVCILECNGHTHCNANGNGK